MSDDEVENNYKDHANLLKDQGNDALQSGDLESAIKLYTQAIDMDPDNHVFFSNRSAAYMKVDSISKALHDAEKCVELAPKWSKGYGRLGAAQHGLKRFNAAMDTYKKGIEIDPKNQSLWTALRSCQEAHEDDKKSRFAKAAVERKEEESRLQRQEDARNAIKQATLDRKNKEDQDMLADFLSDVNTAPVPPPTMTLPSISLAPPTPPKIAHASSSASTSSSSASTSSTTEESKIPETAAEGQDDLLSGFFSELQETKAASQVHQQKTEDALLTAQELPTEKYMNQDLGDGLAQHARLTSTNCKWKNLNPYYVLQLDIDATDEDIKCRYRKLSTKVHPDKLRLEDARESFEQVKIAYQKLCDENQKKTIIMNIEHVRSEASKDRRRLLGKGVKESEMLSLEDEVNKRLMKHFADIEMQRLRGERILRDYNARDRQDEDFEKEKLKYQAEFDKDWSEGDRREKRVGNWRDFQEDPGAKKVHIASYKEETRIDKKHGVAKVETWKKQWK